MNPKEGNAFENLKHAGIARKIPLYHGNVLLEDFHLATEWLMAGQIGSLLYNRPTEGTSITVSEARAE